jgi:hypothetical protein
MSAWRTTSTSITPSSFRSSAISTLANQLAIREEWTLAFKAGMGWAAELERDA